MHVYVYVYINYVVYKPRLGGVFNKHKTQFWGQKKFATDKPQAQRARGPKGKGFISGKLLMTKDKGHMFVKYTE